MQVAVYTIALNEEQFVRRWYESAKDADYLLIADTGSTDNTVAIAKELGINVVSLSVSPWRFDDARNAALAALPSDIDMCISLDMDEVITPNWREPLEKAWKAGVTRPRYKHIWSWNQDGSPGTEFSYDHIHTRKGYRWKHPVHECLYAYGMEEKQAWIGEIETHHHPDPLKSRSQYLPLLNMAVQEDPYNDRNSFYYARELYFYRKYEEAAAEFKRHLSLPSATWKPERAASLRYLAKCEPKNAVTWLKAAVAEDSTRRESRMELALQYYGQGYWNGVFVNAKYCIENLLEKPLDYLCEDFAWGALPYDLGALAAYHLGDKELAARWGTIAVELDPKNDRLQRNLAYYQAN
jgi:glycosyltransferase involved in cell wall biosynthesis